MEFPTEDKPTIGIGSDSQSSKAINLVMHTLKERCYLLQCRLATVEEENLRLCKQCTRLDENSSQDNDIHLLNTKLAHLSKENAQLKQRIVMVACENNNLWAKLESLTPEEDKKRYNICHFNIAKINESKENIPQLIRSQTFTQNSPNPKLIAKLEEKEVDSEASLEEISLKILNSFIEENNDLVLQYKQMVELQKEPDFKVNTVGFTYLGDGMNYDSLTDIKKYTDKMIELKNVVLQQQTDLKNYIAKLETEKQEEKLVATCITKNSSDLSKEVTEIDSPETEVLDSSTRWATPANSTSYHDNIDDSSCSQNTSRIMNNVQTNSKTSSKNKDDELNFNIQEKKNHNSFCPMCGKKFQSTVTFENYVKHVESHFVDEDYNSSEKEITSSLSNNN